MESEVKETNESKVKPSRERRTSLSDEGTKDDHDVDAEENESSSSPVTHIRRRHFKKPKPLFYIGGFNGASLVEETLSGIGWERISDKTREDYRLKWCEIKSHNNYHCFREGEQLCYQIPNNKLLTTKIGLLTSLQEYDRVMNKVKKGKPRIMRYQEFFPETYRLDVKDDRELFFETYIDNETWISKPTGMNQGKGIYLIRNQEDINKLQEKIAEVSEEMQSSRKLPFKVPMARIVQRYVTNPLLLDNRKFDVRNYLLIACTNPLVVFYGDGYCRLTCMPYDHDSSDLTGHLTNQFMQKKNPLYEEVKEDTVWSMDKFNDYVNENFMEKKNLPEDWVHTVLKRRCQQVMLHCFQAVRHKLECKLGYFDLMGCDFLIDDDFKISLLEMNCNPALHTNCETLKDLMPIIVDETLKLALEIFDKSLKRERIMPLAAQNHFILLYNGDVIEAAERRERMQSTAEARRRARSAQRRKRFVPGQFVYKRTAAPTSTTTTPSTSSSSATATTVPHVSAACNHSGQNATVPNPIPTSNNGPTTTYRNPPSSTVMSSTVTSSTAASQQRVAKSKSTPNVSLKPFYAGGTVASRPYSAPKFNRNKFSQVESKILSYNSVCTMESPRRDSLNNAALNAASNAKAVNYTQKVKSVSLTPKREDVETEKIDEPEVDDEDEELEFIDADVIDQDIMDEEFINEMNEQLDAIEREQFFEEILEEDEEDGIDIEEDEEEMIRMGSSPEARKPSARLPISYHSITPHTHLISGGKTPSNWSKLPQPMQSMQKKITKIASLSVRGNIDLPLPTVGTTCYSPRPSVEHGYKMQFRAPTAVRVRQSLQATTCTLEIGPKARRGLIAVPPTNELNFLTGSHSTEKPGSNKRADWRSKHGNNDVTTANRKLANITKLKLINAASNQSDEQSDASSALIHLAAAHLTAGMKNDHDLRKTYPGGAYSQTGSVVYGDQVSPYAAHYKQPKNKKYKSVSDSSTQTNRRRRPVYTGEEKVIWRLRSRANDHNRLVLEDAALSIQNNGGKTRKTLMKVPIVTQSPSLYLPRKVSDPLNRRTSQINKKNSSNGTASTVAISAQSGTNDVKESQSILADADGPSTTDIDPSTSYQRTGKPTALSKVVAVATAVPTHCRTGEGKPKGSSSFNSEPSVLTAG